MPESRSSTPLSAVILTLNEAKNLLSCLRSIRLVTPNIFVVDSGSQDDTTAIAEREGAKVYSHTFSSHAEQWQWALDHVPFETDWIIAIDADQIVTPELARSLRQLLERDEADVVGGYVCRRQVFRGKWIRFGGYYPKYLLKVFRRSAVRIEASDLVDHHFTVDGRAVKLSGDLIESNRNEDVISVWIEKHNKYAARQAQEELMRAGKSEAFRSIFGEPDARIRLLKSLWRRQPLYVRPVLYFFYRYVLRLGFLDGKEGFVFHALQAFWYRLLVDINIDELRSAARWAARAGERQ